MNSNSLIKASNIRLSLEKTPVLDGVELAVHEGEIVTLIGPNGAGKTTLLRVLMGTIHPREGTVTRQAGLKIGYVPQHMEAPPFLPMTVEAFLSLRMPAANPTMKETIEALGITPFLSKDIQSLSGGQWQRVLLARAILRRPNLLILDEPMQGIDLQGQLHLYAYLEQLVRREHIGLLMVSHDLHLVMRATDHVICLNRHICCEGSPEMVRDHEAFRQLFGPEAEQVLALYAHHHDHSHEMVEECAVEGCDAH